VTSCNRFNIFAPDLFPVAVAQHRFEDNPDAHRQPRNFANALFFQRRERKEKSFAPLTGVEFFERFGFVVHAVVVMSSEVETSLAILFRRYPEIPRLRSE